MRKLVFSFVTKTSSGVFSLLSEHETTDEITVVKKNSILKMYIFKAINLFEYRRKLDYDDYKINILFVSRFP